ncbi:MAG: Response regulators consisting of a CheY-like receiver domain and a winged-helix DNA-binding domain [Rhodobacteraceae bacterium HLUCCA12]|nr:MAG: Response regulators consisting of a CheY-like receiver domain and a winged-helix DNA-binding domain [Rhodobacteraceae bacterium HLUCCA12]
MNASDAPLILCCEDEPQLLRDITDELREAGYRVIAAESGTALLALLADHRPDLVLCDIMMPGIDGYGVLAGLRRDHPHLAHVPLIFLSALSMTESVIRGKRAGADDYLTKPIDYDLLLSTIEARLRQSAQARGTNARSAGVGRHLLRTLSVGLLILDADGRLTETNPAARQMVGLDRAATTLPAALNAPVRKMAACARSGDENSLSLPLDDTAEILAQVHACPADAQLGTPAGVLVYLIDRKTRVPLSATALTGMFGLTPTESQVARHLARGLRPDQIAHEMGIAQTTIAFHLRNAFAKTGTHRQAELVALLLSLPLRETG